MKAQRYSNLVNRRGSGAEGRVVGTCQDEKEKKDERSASNETRVDGSEERDETHPA